MPNINLDHSEINFDRDRLIQFDEATHTYTVDNLGTLTSVSNVVARFFRPFDAKEASLKKCNYDEEAAERLREEWECKGVFASQAGTHLHLQIENYLNGKGTPQMTCHCRYDGKTQTQEQDIDISREWQHFLAFDRDTEYQPFRTEWRVYADDERIAGTIDLTCIRPDGTYEIYDWKRSGKIDPVPSRVFHFGINGLELLPDTAFYHYCIQQNLYRYILQTYYGLTVSRLHLVVLHPTEPSYRIEQVPLLDKEVRLILDYIKNNPA